MLERLLHMETGVYVLWGIGLLGLLLKMIANTYLKRLLRESENMATTRTKGLRRMRQTYENGRSLGIRNGSSVAFAEKQVRKMRLLGKPFDFWRRIGETLTCVLVAICACSFLYYDVSWRGSPDMISFLVNGVIVGACLLALENIFLTNNKVERLKANICDYLDNLTPIRQTERGAMQLRASSDAKKKMTPVTEQREESAVEKREGLHEIACASERDEEDERKKVIHHARDENSIESGEELNRFLREFFS